MTNLYQLYLITNTVNNKKYVGQSIKRKDKDYLTRFKEHIDLSSSKHLTKLRSAIRHYGIDAFKTELLLDDVSESDIDNQEKYYIDYYNTYYLNDKGYNMTRGGQGIHGYLHTETTKQKISNASRKLWEEYRKNKTALLERNTKISNSLKGKAKSEETKKRFSEAARKNTSREDYINPFKGRTHTNECKRKISEANGHKIGMYDKSTKKLIKEFNSVMRAANYLVEIRHTKNKGCFSRIITVANHTKGQGKTAYGFIWEYIE